MPDGDEPNFLEGFADGGVGGNGKRGHFDLILKGSASFLRREKPKSNRPGGPDPVTGLLINVS
jgi:hypothetical protein